MLAGMLEKNEHYVVRMRKRPGVDRCHVAMPDRTPKNGPNMADTGLNDHAWIISCETNYMPRIIRQQHNMFRLVRAVG